MADDTPRKTTEEQNDESERSQYWNELAGGGEATDSTPDMPAEEPGKPTPEVEPQGDDEPEEQQESAAKGDGDDSGPHDEGEEKEEEDDEEGDPWEGVSEKIRREFELLKEKADKVDEFEHERRSQSGRVGALQKKINELSRKLEEYDAKRSESPTKEDDPGDSIFDFPEWKQYEDDFGDVAKPQKAAMRRLFETLHSRLQNTDKISQAALSAENQRVYAEQAADLERRWPNWRQFIDDNADEFNAFVQAKPHRQALLEPNRDFLTDADAGEELLTLFKSHMQKRSKGNGSVRTETEPKPKTSPRPMTEKRKQQLRSAGAPPPRVVPAPGSRHDGLPDENDPTAAWEYFASKATRG